MASKTEPTAAPEERGAGKTRFVHPPDEPVILIMREFDAPRALVWEAFTRSQHMARWWGPRRYTVLVKEMDVRPGGKWRIIHRGADGERWEFFGEYLEVAPPERLVQTFGFADFPPSTETAVFRDLGTRTRMEAVARYDSMASRDGMAAAGMEAGARESYERLDALLAEFGR
jgi:uncharacterized protein YndB with AHSA1/START domain